MKITGLDHYNVKAPAPLLAEVRRFYLEVIGLTEGPRPAFRSSGHWLYAAGQPLVHLTVAEDDEAEVGRGHCDHVAFRCEDYEAARARLEAHSVAYTLDEVPGWQIRQIFCQDPAGVGVELNCRD